jgi:hypothetical protein
MNDSEKLRNGTATKYARAGSHREAKLNRIGTVTPTAMPTRSTATRPAHSDTVNIVAVPSNKKYT